MKNYLFLLALLAGCGIDLRHKGVPDKVETTVGPDFAKAAAFCDDRYGAKSPEAESCFQDYRDYTKIKVSLDMESLQRFCETNYPVEEDRVQCVEDVMKTFESILGTVTTSGN